MSVKKKKKGGDKKSLKTRQILIHVEERLYKNIHKLAIQESEKRGRPVGLGSVLRELIYKAYPEWRPATEEVPPLTEESSHDDL